MPPGIAGKSPFSRRGHKSGEEQGELVNYTHMLRFKSGSVVGPSDVATSERELVWLERIHSGGGLSS